MRIQGFLVRVNGLLLGTAVSVWWSRHWVHLSLLGHLTPLSPLSPSESVWVLSVLREFSVHLTPLNLFECSQSFAYIWLSWMHLSPSESSESIWALWAVHNIKSFGSCPQHGFNSGKTDQSDNNSRSTRWLLLLPLFMFIHLYIYNFLWLLAPSRRDELFALHENCGKSIFHFLLGPGLHLCCNYRRDSSRSSKAFKKQAASRPSWLINLDRMTSGSSPLKASASRDTSVPVLLTRLVFRCRFGLESSGWATVSRKKK